MKKILIILITILFLSAGCQKKYELDPELLNPLRSAVMDYLNQNGYDENSAYILEGPYTSEGKSFPCIYVLSENGEPKAGVLCEYHAELGYGGINYPYKDGYVSCFAHPDFLSMKEGWKTERNEVNVNNWLFHEKGVVVDEKDNAITEDAIKLMTSLFMGEAAAYPENISVGDKIAIYGPVIHYYTRYDTEKDFIHLSQQEYQEYIAAVNDEPVFSINYDGVSQSMSTSVIDSANPYSADLLKTFKEGKAFIILHPEIIVTNQTVYEDNLLPVLSRKALKTVMEKVKTMGPYECVTEFKLQAQEE